MAQYLSSLSTIKNSLILIIVFITIYLLLPQLCLDLGVDLYSNSMIIYALILPPIFMTLAIYSLYSTIFIKWSNFLHLKYWAIFKSTAIGISIALGVNMIWVSILTSLKFEYQEPPINALLTSDNISISITVIILAVLLAPIAEELTFRKIIYDDIYKISSPKYALILTSLLFSIAHFGYWQIPGLFVLGVYFQKQRTMHDNIESSIISHAINNGFAVLLLLFITKYNIN